MRKRASEGGIERLSEERKALVERYMIDAAEAQRREQLAPEAAGAREAERQERAPASTKPAGEVVRLPQPEGSPHPLFSVRSRCLMLLGFTAVAAGTYSTDWHSPVRVGITTLFLLFLPGLALAELAPLTQPVERLVVGIGASLAIETLLAVAFLYGGFFTPGRVFVVLLVATALFTGVAAIRTRQLS
jgi:hypothetical protein